MIISIEYWTKRVYGLATTTICFYAECCLWSTMGVVVVMCRQCLALCVLIERLFGHRVDWRKLEDLIESSPIV